MKANGLELSLWVRRILARKLPACRCCRGAQFPDASCNLCGDVVQDFGCFLRQQATSLFRKTQAIFVCDCQGLSTGGIIRADRTAGNHIQRIAENITQNDTEHLRRGTQLGKPSAFDAGKPFAYGIDFHNIRAASQQLVCNILQFFSRQKRSFKQCASAA